jgi:hypothetical protein
MASRRSSALVPIEHITESILLLRGQKVLLDAELAALYGVTTKRLNEQVKRNAERFPEDFLFRLTAAEVEALNRSHFATGSQKHRDSRFPPYAFTEHGAIMAATILNSPRAIEMSVYVVRAFVKLAAYCFRLKHRRPDAILGSVVSPLAACVSSCCRLLLKTSMALLHLPA